jgi:hypothetical protein
MGLHRFFKCIAQAVLHRGARGLANLVPFGGSLWDIAEEVCRRLHDQPDADVRAEVQAVAQAEPAQVQAAVADIVLELTADQPPEVALRLASYLSRVPDAVRQSNRRPADPSGKTVAAGRTFADPREVLPLLPQGLPRFQPGDRPLPASTGI